MQTLQNKWKIKQNKIKSKLYIDYQFLKQKRKEFFVF